jgi:adenylate kinase family enzyme
VAGSRITVAGISGSGKTTVSRAISSRLSLPHIELDALHHGPNWTEASAEELRRLVETAFEEARHGWVADGNYRRKLGTFVLDRADTFVWLDLPLRVCLWRVWKRSWGRILRREELWNGNRETIRGSFLASDSVVRWALKRHRVDQEVLPALLATLPHLRVVHLRSEGDVERWLDQLPPRSPS